MKITFIGTGYVGLVSGVMLSHIGHEITCLDVDQSKINALKKKKSVIFEPGLSEYIEKYANTSRLNFVCGYNDALLKSECVFVTVGTPAREDGDADLSLVYDAIESLCKHISQECIIVIKSTVPPGTCSNIQDFIYKNGYKNEVVSNPEFLREGSAIKDFLEPDRIIIGSSSQRTMNIMHKIYNNFIERNIPIIDTDLKTSELIKYASNTFLATKIAFINELSDLCEVIGTDICKLSEGIGLDKRIGKSFLNPGPGFGGSCFPKDILALQSLSKNVKSDFLLLDAVIEANKNRPINMLKKIKYALGDNLKDKKLAILGITYKAGTDDVRNSPAIELINCLKEEDAIITVYDPEGMPNIHKYFDNLECASSYIEAINGADAIIIATEWEEFKKIDLEKIIPLMKSLVIIDLRNILDSEKVRRCGFKYYSVGSFGER